MKIQTISLKPSSIGENLVKSLKETGFAVITDHDIPMEMFDKAYATWADYFASEEKVKDLFSVDRQRGYYPMKSENAKGFNKKDLKEFFHLYPDMHLGKQHGASDMWMLYESMARLGQELLTMISANSPIEFSIPLQNMAYKSPQTLLRILHYPPIGDDSDGAVRAAAHEDINLITLLPAATYPGLQVKTADGEWVLADMNIPKNAIIVNAGDMLQEASGGYFKSTTHRVVNPTGYGATISRYSMPMFIHPHADVRLSEKYTAGEYLDERLRELGLK
jgi:isopenicillin N synthase-like dioxygenase